MLMPFEAREHDLNLKPDFREELIQIEDPEIRQVFQRFSELLQEGSIKIQNKVVYTWEKDPTLLTSLNTKPGKLPEPKVIILVDPRMENTLGNRRILFGKFFDAVGFIDGQRGTIFQIQEKRNQLCAKIN